MIDITKIKKKEKVTGLQVNIRISRGLSDWIKSKNYSPTSLFVEACKSLGYKNKEIE